MTIKMKVQTAGTSTRSLIDEIREAAEETVTRQTARTCKECSCLYGPKVHELTRGFCAPCYLEIKFSIIPKATILRYR